MSAIPDPDALPEGSDPPDSSSANSQHEYRTYGRRTFSIAALLERIEAAFVAEMRPETLLGATSDTARRELIREVADYVLAIESIRLPRVDYLNLIDALDAILFRFGPLDPYLKDETVSEIAIDAPQRIYIRRALENPQPVPEAFIDEEQLARIVQRLLATGGTLLSEETPFVETGLHFAGRPARITAAMPPVSAILQVGVRLHPTKALTMAALVENGALSAAAAAYLEQAVTERRGIMIAGDVGAGKTTLLQALLGTITTVMQALPGTNGSAAAHAALVERAAELRPPADMTIRRYSGLDFDRQVQAALDQHPACLILDEVRSEDSPALWNALSTPAAPALLWAIQGSTNPLRVRMTFNMIIQRTSHTLPAETISDALLGRLPVAVLISKRRVVTIGQWRMAADGSIRLEAVPDL